MRMRMNRDEMDMDNDDGANSLTGRSLTPVRCRRRGRTRLGVVDHTARLEVGHSTGVARYDRKCADDIDAGIE